MNRTPRTLEEAYLSVAKNPLSYPDRKKDVSTSPVREIAPGLKISTIEPDEEDMDITEDGEHVGCNSCGTAECNCDHEESDTTGHPITMGAVDHPEHGMEGDSRFSTSDEDEEDDITVDNIHSIRESLLKISMAVAAGVHMEPWQQFKIAVVMDNLASVARSLPRQSCL
jgi:hypothetical protein